MGSESGNRRCLICGKPQQQAFKPFCSQRCADIDLGRWLGGRYRIETDEKPDENPPPPENE